jgi:hypothetical protein
MKSTTVPFLTFIPLVGNFFLAFAAWSIYSAKAAGRMRWRTC